MVDGLYWEQWPNNQNITDPDDLGYIFYENKLLGRPRLRMLKVKKNSCKVPDAFSTQIKECYDVYSSAVEEKAPFGPNNRCCPRAIIVLLSIQLYFFVVLFITPKALWTVAVIGAVLPLIVELDISQVWVERRKCHWTLLMF